MKKHPSCYPPSTEWVYMNVHTRPENVAGGKEYAGKIKHDTSKVGL